MNEVELFGATFLKVMVEGGGEVPTAAIPMLSDDYGMELCHKGIIWLISNEYIEEPPEAELKKASGTYRLKITPKGREMNRRCCEAFGE